MGEENPEVKGADEFKAITSQADLDRIIGERISRERGKYADYDDLKTKAAEYDKAQEASKTELQKERERAEAAEKERDKASMAGWRAEVALAKGLTVTQAKRLVDTTKEELEKDADELLADLGAKPGTTKKADPKKLQSGSSGNGDQLTGKERAAAALRQMRGTN